ncbi:MAG: glutaredoxin domain-containing protein [Gammaproteobacteria bacterium]
MKKLFLVILISIAILFSVERLAAHLHLPKQGSTAVVIYTTEWCPYCTALKSTLNQYRIPFTEHDTEKSIQGIAGYWALSAHGVPVSVIGEEVIHGYDGQIITDALVGAGYDIPPEWPSAETQ